jgi:RNA polymerase-binding transcription factor DksA
MKTVAKSKFSFPLQVLQPIRDYLVNQQAKLLKRQKQLTAEDPFSDASRVDDNAALDADAAEISGHDRVSALKWEVDKGLVRVRQTLTRMKLGKYGLCARCGEMIDTDRLAVDPTVELCVTCGQDSR